MKYGLYLVLNRKETVAAGRGGYPAECSRLARSADKKLKELFDGAIYLKPSGKCKILMCTRAKGKSVVYEAYTIERMKIMRTGDVSYKRKR
jgi:hypothetical protein